MGTITPVRNCRIAYLWRENVAFTESKLVSRQEMHSESTNLRQSGGSGFRTVDL